MQSLTVKSKCPHCGKEHSHEYTLEMVLSMLDSSGVDLDQALRDAQRLLPLWRLKKSLFGIRG